jgi:hypothetical protein
MRAICVLTVAAVLVAPGFVAAQTGAAGKWTGETQGRGGTQQIVLQLKVDGGTLTGTYQQGEQPAAEIKEGKVVDASTITFKRTVMGRGGEITIEYTGKISGAELTLTPMVQGGGPGGGGGGRGPMPITLKRAS